jgi:hypothetical protein
MPQGEPLVAAKLIQTYEELWDGNDASLADEEGLVAYNLTCRLSRDATDAN